MNRKELKAALKSDKRTKEEVFQDLVAQMKQLSREEMSDGEAAQAARVLIAFCSTLIYGEPAKRLDSKCSFTIIEDGTGNSSGVS
jgi:ABC-type cobalamin/Fe3+-siderophores transport system ATPase subunit